MRTLRFILLLFYLVLSITAPQAAERIKIGVLDLRAKGEVKPSTAEVISEKVRIEFAKEEAFLLTDKDRVKGILDYLGFEQGFCEDKECLLRVGELARAEKMITGFVGNLGNKYILFLRVLDVETGGWRVTDQEEKILRIEDLDQLVLPLVKRIIQKLKAEKEIPQKLSGYNSIIILPLPGELIIKGAKIIIDRTDTTFSDLPGIVENLKYGRHNLKIDAEEYFGTASFYLTASPSPFDIELEMIPKEFKKKKKVWLGVQGGYALGFGNYFKKRTLELKDDEGVFVKYLEHKNGLLYSFGATMKIRINQKFAFIGVYDYQKGEMEYPPDLKPLELHDKEGYYWRYIELDVIRFMSTTGDINPYFEGGGGVFTFRYDSQDIERTNLGLNIGFGLEKFLQTNLSMDVGIKLHVILKEGANPTFFQIYTRGNFGI